MTVRAGIIGTALAVAALALPSPAAAQRLVSSLSTHQVRVTSNYTGADLVLFGTVEPTDTAPLRPPGSYDIAITVSGPRETMVTRRKGRVLGVWANVESRQFINVPSYLAVVTTRPVGAIAPREELLRHQIGLNNTVLTQRIGTDFADVVPTDPFRRAFMRIKQEQGLYSERPNAVTFLSPSLFRADISLPAQVIFGSYDVEVELFADGRLLARDQGKLDVRKDGFEEFVARSAREHSLLYGLAAMTMALMVGWLSSVIFRRD